ncbi:MAG: 16S rRNA (cytidine(1402)-2'-O)-methyltransferase [Pseudomonadota bacterium]
MSSADPPKGDATPRKREPIRGPEPAQAEPGLHVVSTPIGNLRDITLRALDTLAAADEVLAEDTRNARRLLDAHGLSAKLTAYHDHNGAARRPELLEKLRAGAAIALISDAGTPLVSDPGWKLVRACLDAGVKVIPVPGASALLAGIVAAGLPSDRFMFAGFPPAKPGARKALFQDLSAVPSTLVFYEGAPRLAASLADMSAVFGAEREAAVARELTKLFEETRRGNLDELSAYYSEHGAPKGEIVVLVGPPEAAAASEADLDTALADALSRLPVKEAAAEVAEALNLPRRAAYQRALALKRDDG